MPGPIDLHTHSSVSDGTETPAELMRAAVAAGLGTVAITDHDSTAGWQDAFDAAAGTGLRVIPGMELSTRHGYKSVHLLAYLIDPDNPALREETLRIREARLTRAEAIVSRLAADFDISWADVVAHTAHGATVGRPHIADALVARGVSPDRSAAFRDILHPKFGYYEPHYAPDPLTAIQLVRAAGGVPVLAHPGTRGVENVITEEHLGVLVDAGLFGLEIHHRENTPDAMERLFAYADTFDLVVTGSSDYHGAGKPNRLGENTTDPEVLERILAEGTGSTAFLG
ncbi:MAG: PHP domain-containing protein [Salinibacterium sp.]|nr:PHP domain-containing protein [Cryobacterium sp.]MCB1281510.1 PHP domain-containing protein [Salinibacterium sp.]